jgi:hypothetical protein
VQIVNSTGKYQYRYPEGGTSDISHILMFYWFEPALYLDPVSKFPETKKRHGYFVGFADNVGDVLKFKILKNNQVAILHKMWFDQQLMPIIGNKECHLSQV